MAAALQIRWPLYPPAPVRAFLRELTAPPAALTRPQRWLLGALTLVVAVSRRYALSKSPLDWDESLFACGVRAYDVVAEHPHPPGYPLFILVAKAVRLAVPDDFHSLQAVASIASLLLFPATFFLLRELRFRFRVALLGAVVTVFLPTVWYYGGTALSDLPALCSVVAASALLLAGGRNPRAWIAGMFVLGVTGGIRPMHVVIAAVPALLGAAAMRRPRTIAAGCALFAAVVAASYAGAALASQDPPMGYVEKIGEMTGHIRGYDSYLNASRPPLRRLVPMWFVTAPRGGRAGLALLALAAIGLAEGAARRRVSLGVVVAMFAPVALASWIMLDISAVTRYALAYVLLYSVAGAYGIDVVARLVRNDVAQSAIAAIGTVLLVIPMILWTRPALFLVRHQISPPVAAMRWIRANLPQRGPTLYLANLLHFHAWYGLTGYDTQYFDALSEIPSEAYATGNYCVIDGLTLQPHARVFRFPQDRLSEIARRAFFDVSIIPMNAMIRFGDGWYLSETDASHTSAWQWMGADSTMLLPPLASNGVLRLAYHLPIDGLPRPPKLTILWNGTVIDSHMCKDFDEERRYVLASRSGAPNECRILLDEALQPNGDPRRLGLQLTGISWERADGLPYGF